MTDDNVTPIDIKKISEVDTSKLNRFIFESPTLSARCFYIDSERGYSVEVYFTDSNNNLFSNFNSEKLTMSELRKILKIYGFVISEKIFDEIKSLSNKRQSGTVKIIPHKEIDIREFS